MIRAAVISTAALALLAGCSDPSDAVRFDGQLFKGRLQVMDGDKRSFTATVEPVSASLEGAREAARYEGTTYCVRKYGRSDIDWTASPEAEATALNISEDTLTVQGRCAE